MLKAYGNLILYKIGFIKYCFRCDKNHYAWTKRRSHYRCWRYTKKGRTLVKCLQEYFKA